MRSAASIPRFRYTNGSPTTSSFRSAPTILAGLSACSARAADAMPSRFLLTPEILLKAYQAGIFPMAESANDPELFWVDPERRGILPLDSFHPSRRLRRVVRQNRFEIRVDSDFSGTLAGC